MIRAIDHINLVVSDLERSVQFYTEILGLRETQRVTMEGDWIEEIVGLQGVRAEVVYVTAPDGEPRLELSQYFSPRGEMLAANSLPNTLGLRHLAFRVNNIHNIHNRLMAKGVKVFGNPVAVPAPVVHHELGQKILFYFLDPDGVLLEVTEYR